jgi:ankyrin repeat protein
VDGLYLTNSISACSPSRPKQFLLKQPKIDVNIKDDRGQTALDAARINGKEDAAGLLEGHLSGAC